MIRIVLTIVIILTCTCCVQNKVTDEVYQLESDEIQELYMMLSPDNDIGLITSGDLKELKSGLTLEEMVYELGATRNVGSGFFVLVYIVDDEYTLKISFPTLEYNCEYSGEELLMKLEPKD